MMGGMGGPGRLLSAEVQKPKNIGATLARFGHYFRPYWFGVTLAQDLTYTIGWLIFGLGMLMAGIYLKSRAGRVAAVALIAVTTCKAFLYDMGSLGGLYRVGALVGLAISLSLVALALQKFVLQAPKEA